MRDDRAERKPPGGGAASEASRGGGGRYEEAGPARICRARHSSLLFFNLRWCGIYNKVVDIFRFVLYAFE